MHPVFAQNLVEYGMLGSLVTAVQGAFYGVRDWVSQSPGEAWTLVALVAVFALLIGRRPK